MAKLETIAAWLDRTLDTAAFAAADRAHNGLQVAHSGRVRRVAAGVDASLAFFERAARRGADLLLCHHGISWGDSLARLEGFTYRRVKFLVEHDLALYAAHLPLDAHPRLGNNARLARALGITRLKPFGSYHGMRIGFHGALPRPMAFTAFVARARRLFGREPEVMAFGKATIRRIAVVSGGAAGLVEEAGRQGIEVFVSGEPSLEAYHPARELGVHALFGGHYATETFGVRALAESLGRRFRIPAEFIACDVPY